MPLQSDTGATLVSVDDREQWTVSQVSGYPGLPWSQCPMVSASDATDHTNTTDSLCKKTALNT